jgi:hypothetical protein
MSDAFTYYLPPEGTTGSAADYASSFGGVQLPQAPAFDVQTQSAAPAQTFTPTDTGYTPTFDFSAFQGALPSYGMPQQQTSLADLPAFGATPVAAQIDTGTISPALSQAIQRGMNISPIADILRSYGAPAAATPTSDLYAQPVDTSAGTSQTQAAPQQGGLSDILKNIGGVKGLTSIAGGLLGYLANQRAQQQAEDVGNQIKAAYQNAAQQTQALAQPYITAGTPQLSMALQGALSPAQLQQYQAQQARLAQAAAKSGGIGAIQTAAAEQSAYQQALQNQQALALQLLAPGNELMSQAINQELQGTTQGLGTTLQYQTMANEAAAKLFQQLGSVGASSPQSQTNPGVQ